MGIPAEVFVAVTVATWVEAEDQLNGPTVEVMSVPWLMAVAE